MKKLIALLIFTPLITNASAIVEESYEVTDRSFLSVIRQQPDLTLDHVSDDHFEVHGPHGLGAYLSRIGAPVKPAMTNLKASPYPTPEAIAQELRTIAGTFPATTKLFSIGRSVQGRDLLVMKISRNAAVDDARPEFKFVANMHGDEIVGRELMVRLIRDLVSLDGRDPFVTKLLDEVQIYIMPSMNPDGAAASRRGNGANYDLNRDFPDFSTNDNQNVPNNRQPETQAMMRWQAMRKFRLSANFHGGAEVVNYPWDTAPQAHPQDALVKALSLDYAQRAPYIAASTTFKNGITNGYAWYEVDGGMQDWSYYWHGDLQLTIELSNTKWPDYANVDYYYQQNRTALMTYIGRVRELPARRN